MEGLDVKRTRKSSNTTLTLGGLAVPVSSFEGEQLVIAVPGAKVQLAFTKESLKSALTKLLWPEITLGDPDFDATVVARTSTPDEARALLAHPEHRNLVLDVVAAGGTVTVNGNTATLLVPDGVVVSDDAVASFVRALA